MINTCLSFKVNLCIYILNHNTFDNSKFTFSYETMISAQLDFNNYNPFIPTILIGWINSNHYELLFPINNGTDLPCEYINTNTNINSNINVNVFNNNLSTINKIYLNQKDKNIVNISIKDKNIISNINKINIPENKANKLLENNVNSNDSKNKANLDKYEKELSNFVENKVSIYPKLNGCISGNTRLEDIYNFLKSNQNYNNSKNNQSKHWPKYINEAIEHNKNLAEKNRSNNQDTDEKETKIMYSSKLKGRGAVSNEKEDDKYFNIKYMKSFFKRSCKNYYIKNDKLYYKKRNKYKNNKGKWIYETIDYYVPKIDELNKLLYKYHTDSCHSNYKQLKESFLTNKIWFLGMDKLLQDYVVNCQVCCQSSRNLQRSDPIKSINYEGPDSRYAFDLTYLNEDMSKAFGIKYILSIIDCFSRKGNIYGTNSKNSELLLKYIEDFCVNHNIPKEFISDNGAEFKNKYFKDFCIKYNIKFLHGAPYSPHSQGIVERFNYSVKKYLSKEYISNNCKNLNFEEIKFKVINYYNNKKHRILGISPNEAYKITDPNKIKEINDIKNKLFEKINGKRTYLNENDTCLLNPKFLKLGKKTLVSNFVKKGKISEKIPVKILSNASFGYYNVEICKLYKNKDVKLKIGDEYVVDCKLLKKINSKTWDSIVSKH